MDEANTSENVAEQPDDISLNVNDAGIDEEELELEEVEEEGLLPQIEEDES